MTVHFSICCHPNINSHKNLDISFTFSVNFPLIFNLTIDVHSTFIFSILNKYLVLFSPSSNHFFLDLMKTPLALNSYILSTSNCSCSRFQGFLIYITIARKSYNFMYDFLFFFSSKFCYFFPPSYG